MGSLYEKQGDFHCAVKFLQKGRLPVENLAIFYNRVGVHFAQANNADSAISYFTKAIELQRNFAEARDNLIRAIEIRESAMRAPPVAKFSHEYNNANILFREGNYLKAIDYYQKALQISPAFPKAHNNIGICYIQLSRYEEARHHFSSAIRIDPDFYDAYPNLATLHNQLGEYQDAIKVLNKALLIKKDPDLYHMMADAYFQLGDKASGIQCLEHEKQLRRPGS